MGDGVVIIGAGPAGLAVAAGLGSKGVPYALVDRASAVGASWRSRYDGLHLHTIRWLSGLPGLSIPRRYGRWVTRDDFVGYLEDYAEHFAVRPEFGVEATRIDRHGTGWTVTTSAGSRDAAAVVVATGYSRTPYLPEWPGRDSFPGSVIHSADYARPDTYVGREVLIVGAGNSAAEIALELARAGVRVSLSVRTAPNIVRRDLFGVPSQLLGLALRNAPEWLLNPLSAGLRRISVPDLTSSGLPAPAGDAYSQFLRTKTVPILDSGFVAAIRAGAISVVGPVRDLRGPEVRLTDGRLLRPAAIISATGYRPDLAPLVGALGVLDGGGMPLTHGARTPPTAPGLYFAGITVDLAGLLLEIGRDARAAAAAIAEAAAIAIAEISAPTGPVRTRRPDR